MVLAWSWLGSVFLVGAGLLRDGCVCGLGLGLRVGRGLGGCCEELRVLGVVLEDVIVMAVMDSAWLVSVADASSWSRKWELRLYQWSER